MRLNTYGGSSKRKLAVLLLTVAFVWSSVAVVLRAEESSEKQNGELAEALESVKVSLDDGLQASEAQGTLSIIHLKLS